MRSTPWLSPGRWSGRDPSASRPPFSTSERWRSACWPTTGRNLVAERTRAQNRLRWHLVDLCPDLEAKLPSGALDREVRLRAIRGRLAGLETTRARLARELLERIAEITRE